MLAASLIPQRNHWIHTRSTLGRQQTGRRSHHPNNAHHAAEGHSIRRLHTIEQGVLYGVQWTAILYSRFTATLSRYV